MREKGIYFKVPTFDCGDTPATTGRLEGASLVGLLFLASVQFLCLASPRGKSPGPNMRDQESKCEKAKVQPYQQLVLGHVADSMQLADMVIQVGDLSLGSRPHSRRGHLQRGSHPQVLQISAVISRIIHDSLCNRSGDCLQNVLELGLHAPNPISAAGY